AQSATDDDGVEGQRVRGVGGGDFPFQDIRHVDVSLAGCGPGISQSTSDRDSQAARTGPPLLLAGDAAWGTLRYRCHAHAASSVAGSSSATDPGSGTPCAWVNVSRKSQTPLEQISVQSGVFHLLRRVIDAFREIQVTRHRIGELPSIQTLDRPRTWRRMQLRRSMPE